MNIKLGILGGGQLGKMLIQSAVDLNIFTKVLDPDVNAPCRHLAAEFVSGSLTDFDTVYQFGKDTDLITIEIENVNTEALEKLQQEGVKVFPQPNVIRLIQDKRLQKQFYAEHDIPTAEFILTENKNHLLELKHFLPAVHKLGKAGYDGRGVQKITTEADLDKGFEAPAVLEKLIPFEKEIAVIIARTESGEISVFPATEMVFHPEHNLVEYLFSPADISPAIEQEAQRIARLIVEKLDFVGILAVEMFVTKDRKVLVNEVAPRPHNSGHQTIEANYTSQYQQHLRAILNLPLGSTATRCPAAMINLLGEAGYTGTAVYKGIGQLLALEGAYIHLYGKTTTKPFRKMGHVTVIDNDMQALKKKVTFVKETIKVVSE